MVSFDSAGAVSLWLFREPEDPADAGKDILRDLCGVDEYDLDHQEGLVRESPASVRSLIEPLSYSGSFVDAAVRAAAQSLVTEALGVLAQFDFAYDLSQISRSVAGDPFFLGVFRWHE